MSFALINLNNPEIAHKFILWK